PEMDVDIDQPGTHHAARRVDDLVALEARAYAGDLAALDQHVGGFRTPRRRVYNLSSRNQQAHETVLSFGLRPLGRGLLTSKCMTAIRTATPFVTCSRMTLRGPSATSAANSRSRLIGPGCMMSAWRGASSSTRL